MRVSYGEVLHGRKSIVDYVMTRKSLEEFTVVDVGGSAVGWSLSVSDAFIDVNHCQTDKLQFNFDICRKENWRRVLDHVDTNGKFDYCICTHTLEDIYNPYLVLDMMPLIAKSGIITVPSVKTETNFIENINWSGFVHHRYLFGHSADSMVVAPKLPIIEKIANRVTLTEVEEIRFDWEGSIPYTVFMDNYLGPNTATVLGEYERFIMGQRLLSQQSNPL